jgi:hypothetical protein
MKKLICIFVLGLLLGGCGKQDVHYIEKCADNKTYSYWKEKVNQFEREKGFWLSKLTAFKIAQDDAETKAIYDMINSKQYHIDLYRNASKKTLKEKLYNFTSFKKNFVKCESEFSKNPIYFKEVYK